MKKFAKFVEKELKVVINLEHEELEEFKKLVKETIQEIEKTRKEMSIEERIQLNLSFIHYKLKKIDIQIVELLKLSKRLEPDYTEIALEINHKIKSILKDIIELDNVFLPQVKKSVEQLVKGETSQLAKKINKEFKTYEHVVDKLKKTFSLTSYSIAEIEKMSNVHVASFKTHILM